MTTENSVISVVLSLNKVHILKAQIMFSFIKWQHAVYEMSRPDLLMGNNMCWQLVLIFGSFFGLFFLQFWFFLENLRHIMMPEDAKLYN